MIIIIDSKYPYKGGEPFLDGEIKELAKRNVDVVIFSLYANVGNELMYSLPKNITNIALNYKTKPLELLINMFFTLIDKMLWTDIIAVFQKGLKIKSLLAAFHYCYHSNKYYRRIRRNLKHYDKREVLSFYSYWMHIHGCVCAKLKQAFKEASFVTRCHGYDLYEYRPTSGFLPGRKLIFETANYIAPISKDGEVYLKHKYPFLDERKIKCHYLGTFDYGLNPYKDGDSIVLVSCSNLVPIKRVDLLINALSRIVTIPIKWIHYGTGESEKELLILANNELPKNIEFSFSGYVKNDVLMNTYANNHITLFVNVSSAEGLPVSIMEAMSFGIPVLATDVGGTKEIVKNGENGILIPSSITAEDLANTIKTIICMNTKKYSCMRVAARKTWEQMFDAKKNYDRFFDGVLKIGR